MKNDPVRTLISKLEEAFGEGECFVVSAPGRVNLVGEHTDYTGGFVLPIAIDRCVRMACRPTGTEKLQLVSLDFDEESSFSLEELKRSSDQPWTNYVRGVAWSLKQAGYSLTGFQGVLEGDIPIGAGLSSSAALEVASALAFCEASGLEIARRELALICQRAENDFVGMRCGIMDQYVCLFAKSRHALFLDCASLEHELVPFDASAVKLVVCDTGVKHELAATAYNQRRSEAEEALEILKGAYPGAEGYRNLTTEQVQRFKVQLGDVLYRRARHIVSENERVRAAVSALKAGDYELLGRLFSGSHASLRDDYEVSCEELDLLVELADSCDGVLGSRMTGGGFGGCTIGLVESAAIEGFEKRISEGYEHRFDRRPEIYIFEAADAARVHK